MIRGGDVELSAIPVIDGHCHSITASFQDRPVESFQRIFTAVADGRFIAQHVPHSMTIPPRHP